MNVKPLHNTRSLQSTRSGLMQTKYLRREPIQIRSRIVAREFKSGDRPDLYAGTPPLEALKARISIAGCPQETFSIMHIDVSPAYFSCRSSEACADMITSGGQNGRRRWKIGQLKKSMYGTGTQRAIGSVIVSWDSARRICSLSKETKLQELHMVTISCSQDRQND